MVSWSTGCGWRRELYTFAHVAVTNGRRYRRAKWVYLLLLLLLLLFAVAVKFYQTRNNKQQSVRNADAVYMYIMYMYIRISGR